MNSSQTRRAQGGAATLISVMVLFFVMALVAAYANRNLIVEQRVAQTYQQLGYATEAGNHAVQNMISLLNGGKVNEACKPDPAGANTLRQRLLVFDAQGKISSPSGAKSPFPNLPQHAPFTVLCDRTRNGEWTCQCPLDYKPTVQADDGLPRESAVMRFRPFYKEGDGIGRLGLAVVSCAGPSAGCVDLLQSEFAAVPRVQGLVLLRALKMPPVSALVATGEVDLGTGMAVVHNEPSYGGVALHSGAAITGVQTAVHGPAGTPAESAQLGSDPVLSPLSAEALFRRFFGMSLSDYVLQPAMRQLTCNGDCAAKLRELADSGAHMVWFDGDLVLSGDQELGSSTAPLVLIVRGALTINSPLKFKGVIFSGGDLTWTNPSANASLVQGAMLVAGAVKGDAGATALFDGAIVDRLKLQGGSFVPLPGASWSRTW
jgi:hypothetical protein